MDGLKLVGGVTALLALMVLVPSVFASGYGTSAISLTKSSLSIAPGASAAVGYNVTIATGGTWGTTINIVNNAQLASQGITATLSNSGPNDPPFEGTLTVSASTTVKPGAYTVTLNATGDDPSASNAQLTLNVAAPPVSKNTTTAQPTTSATTSVGGNQSGTPQYPGFALSGLNLYLIIGIIIVLVGAIAALAKKRGDRPAMAIIIGTAIILISTIYWLYTDYTGGYIISIWLSVIGIIIGSIIWLLNDIRGAKRGKSLIILGVVLIAIGIIVWLYGDYTGGNLAYIWGGAVLILIGVLVWLIGDRKEHLI